MVHVAWIGVGANLGDPAITLRQALAALAQLPACKCLATSGLYRSAPLGAGMEGQPDYINAVAALATSLAPQTLLEALFDIEHLFGRQRSHRNAARTLDLDLLLYGDMQINQPGLHVPHPRMHERAFVLAPIAEIAPDLNIPGYGRAADCLAALLAREPQTIEHLPG